ncbi:unnamed protein product, partial [Urochloa humidicola]
FILSRLSPLAKPEEVAGASEHARFEFRHDRFEFCGCRFDIAAANSISATANSTSLPSIRVAPLPIRRCCRRFEFCSHQIDLCCC